METNPELYLQDLIDSNEDELVIKDGGGDAFHDAFIKACRENGRLRQLDKRSIRVQSLYISNYSRIAKIGTLPAECSRFKRRESGLSSITRFVTHLHW